MRFILLPLSMLVFALAPALCFAGALEDAQALKEKGEFAAALPLFEQAISEDAASEAAALGLADVLNGLGRHEDAIERVRAALKANPKSVGLLVASARSNLLQAEKAFADGEDGGKILGLYVAEADAALRAALKEDPKSTDGRVLRAKVLQQQGGGPTDQALALLEEVVADDPNHFDAHWELGQRWFNVARGKQDNSIWAKAEEHFRRCSEIDPQSGASFESCGDAMAWQGKPQPEVSKLYLSGALLLPDREKLLGKLYKWTNHAVEERVAAFRTLEEAHPENANVLLWLAFALKDAGRLDEGLEALDRAADAAPLNAFIPLNEGHLLLVAERSDEAVKAYERAIKTCGGRLIRPIYNAIDGKAYKAPGLERRQREKLWNALWKAWPDEFLGPNDAGLWYRDVEKDYGMSAEWYLRAAKVAQNSAQVQNDTGLILDQYLKRHDEAEAYYRRAIAIGKEQGYPWQGGGPREFDKTGYRDALNNFGSMLAGQKRWKDLARFADEDLPPEHPRHSVWKRMAENKGK